MSLLRSQSIFKGLIDPKLSQIQIRTCFYGRVEVDRDKAKPRKGARRARLAKDQPKDLVEHVKEVNANPSAFWYNEKTTMSFPLARTPHPVNQFAKEDAELMEEVEEKSKCDAPVLLDVSSTVIL